MPEEGRNCGCGCGCGNNNGILGNMFGDGNCCETIVLIVIFLLLFSNCGCGRN